ncbi:CBL-interacting serine/threonine-protein kinase 7-like [Cucurbita pepo subsp. pepo]|uniref:CBL-interacting serine/threonine-protein kinase 7-like n=1 Tax=Cucurbita pepo subsp. pepo TaxID=3664 RepID=UPI000C9D674E|nr:CBL-interacting serine/threonine-protein kinase 7-like [Cucurbita pepo subsp. pepo]
MEPGGPPTPPPLPPLPTGAILLGKYQLGRFLGRGSFAKVYQACSLADNSIVAVKIIDKNKTIDAAMEPCIVREISVMRRLQHHPNILRIHEVMATKTKIYLVVDYASGGELFAKLLRRGRLTESTARRYFQQLVSALHFCHQNGVAHRDIKPQNLLLDEDGNLKVSDFGLSALPEQIKDGMLHTACGTPAYTAPEVVSRRGYDGAKADAWSCGVILFVLLSGHLPFSDNNLVAMYKKVYRREYHFPDSISKPARHLIFQLLDPDPNTRMSMEALMQHSWFKKSLRSKPQINNKSLFESLGNYKSDLGVSGLNAFHIISMSSGLDLSGLFETTDCKKKRFTTGVSMEKVEERVTEIGGELGYRVEKGKSGAIGLGKGRMILVVEALKITSNLLMVEVKAAESKMEFERTHWGDLKAKLQDIVGSWHSNESM